MNIKPHSSVKTRYLMYLSAWICMLFFSSTLALAQSQDNENIPQAQPLININLASLEQLQGLSGVGQSKAQAIIAFRQQQGQFVTIEDLQAVPGIGPSIYDKNKDRISLE